MGESRQRSCSASALRRELSARNLDESSALQEQTYGSIPSVIYCPDELGGHGNFLAASYRRICANELWSRRLSKVYTAGARVPRAMDRRRGELDCANSSDALLMNLFCYPGILQRRETCALLGIEFGLQPEFGVRAGIAMRGGEVDRTEIDMKLGSLLIEAKLTESGFPAASRERVLRYCDVAEVFDIEELPWGAKGLLGYQLVRGVLAAQQQRARFVLLCDARRADLKEMWFRVLRAVRSYELRSGMALVTWQELGATMPPKVKEFLRGKYGISSE